MTTTRRSPKVTARDLLLPDRDELVRLKISGEVAWYLVTRGIPLPDCPPAIKTPEPDRVRGARFDPERVDKVLHAFGLLRHTQGQWAGQPLRPDPWQVAYILAPVFGWVRWDDDAAAWVRIIRKLYVDVPRKNGKSTLLGGIAVYMACADGEPGAQVVTAATSERQAGFVFSPIKTLAEKSPALRKHVRAYTKKIVHPRSGSYIEVVSSVADAQHGANIHCSVTDELHVHKTPDLVETLETGTGSRRQPLNAIITTADSGKQGTIYARKRGYIEQLAAGTIKDAATYGVVWAAPKDANPFSEETWRAANPGYGVSPTRAYMEAAAKEAQNSPADLAKFLRLHLGRRTKQETKYIELGPWDRNASIIEEERLHGRDAYGGLDLAATSDLCALCWLLPDDERGGYDALWRFWTPEGNVAALDKRTAGEASVWIERGLLIATPGDVADYDYIEQRINRDRETFRVRSIGFDPWNATQVSVNLAEDGAPMVKVRQGFATMSPPLKELQRLVLSGTPEHPVIRHGGNPVMRWMIDNLAVATDPAGNVKPDKATSAEKIDGVSALVTALAEAMTRTKPKRSAYEDHDLQVI